MATKTPMGQSFDIPHTLLAHKQMRLLRPPPGYEVLVQLNASSHQQIQHSTLPERSTLRRHSAHAEPRRPVSIHLRLGPRSPTRIRPGGPLLAHNRVTHPSRLAT